MQLYFEFLRNFAILFFVLFIISLLQVQSNLRGNGYENVIGGSFIAKLTLGNQDVPPG